MATHSENQHGALRLLGIFCIFEAVKKQALLAFAPVNCLVMTVSLSGKSSVFASIFAPDLRPEYIAGYRQESGR